MNLLCRLGIHKWYYRRRSPKELRVFPYFSHVISCRRCGIGK